MWESDECAVRGSCCNFTDYYCSVLSFTIAAWHWRQACDMQTISMIVQLQQANTRYKVKRVVTNFCTAWYYLRIDIAQAHIAIISYYVLNWHGDQSKQPHFWCDWKWIQSIGAFVQTTRCTTQVNDLYIFTALSRDTMCNDQSIKTSSYSMAMLLNISVVSIATST